MGQLRKLLSGMHPVTSAVLPPPLAERTLRSGSVPAASAVGALSERRVASYASRPYYSSGTYTTLGTRSRAVAPVPRSQLHISHCVEEPVRKNLDMSLVPPEWRSALTAVTVPTSNMRAAMLLRILQRTIDNARAPHPVKARAVPIRARHGKQSVLKHILVHGKRPLLHISPPSLTPQRCSSTSAPAPPQPDDIYTVTTTEA